MKKKVLLLSTGDNHGAYEAIYRISKFLIEANYEVAMIVKEKTKFDSFIIKVPNLDYKPLVTRVIRRLFPKKQSINFETDPNYYFLNKDESEKSLWDDYLIHNLPFVPDLIIAGLISGFINTTTLSLLQQHTKAKVYMITVDMAPLTGGCHFSWGCEGYKHDCYDCPAILDKAYKNKAHENLIIKKKNVISGDIKILSASGWTYNQSKESVLFKNQSVIYNTNGLTDTRLFNSRHRNYAKEIFNIPSTAKVIFTGSWFTDDKRKGLKYFVDALNQLWLELDKSIRDDIYVLVAGEHNNSSSILQQIPFKKHIIDYIKDYRLLSLAYQASDVFVCASIEDSGPLMVSEALACGTPVVGFEMGVVSNMVMNNYNGYKAVLRDSCDMAKGLNKIISLSREEFIQYSSNAVNQVINFSSEKILVNIINNIVNE